MKYRGLAYDAAEEKHYYVYGLPSYGFNTDEIAEIGTPDGEFIPISPSTLGKATGYKDCTGTEIYTGDITELEVNGEFRQFVVVEANLDREYNVLHGLEGETVRVCLQGVIAIEWKTADGNIYNLLPCIDSEGVCDTAKMRIIGDIHTRAVQGQL